MSEPQTDCASSAFSMIPKCRFPKLLRSWREEERPHGIPHVKDGSHTGIWLFHDLGRYAATVVKNKANEKLKIVIYDCLEKEAYDYFSEVCSIKPHWFYWYGDLLVLIATGGWYLRLRFLCFDLNHHARNAVLIYYKRPDIKKSSLCVPKEHCVEPLHAISMNDIEYMPIFAGWEGCVLFLIPKNPFTDLICKQYFICYTRPMEIVGGHLALFKKVTYPITDGRYIYLLRTMTRNDSSWFRLDSFIRIDLSKLRDVYRNQADFGDITNAQDLSAYREVKLRNATHSDGQSFHVGFLSKIISSLNGSHVSMYFKDNLNKTYEYLFDLKNATWRDIRRNLPSDSDEVYDIFHPLGYTIRLSYGNNQKLSCKQVMSLQRTVPTLKDIAKKNLLLGEKTDELCKDSAFTNIFF